MIRRIVDEQNTYRRQKLNNNKLKTSIGNTSPLILMIPICFVSFGILVFVFALRYQSHLPIQCVRMEMLECSSLPSSMVIGIHVSNLQRSLKMNATWINISRHLGITIQQFYPISIPYNNAANEITKLPSEPYFEQSIYIWKSLYTKYHKTHTWFMKVLDSTFVQPYLLMKNVICKKDGKENWFIGEKGYSYQTKKLSFAGSGAGLILSRSALKQFLEYWENGLCPFIIAEDVTIANCLTNVLQIPLTSHTQFQPNFVMPYFRPWDDFVTVGSVLHEEVIDIIAHHVFDHCDYPR